MIKTFKGKMSNESQDSINLHTNDGRTGYKIRKLEVVDTNPGAATKEVVVKVYTEKQTAVDGVVNFSDMTLIGVGVFATSADSYNTFDSVIFENTVFNQDIHITCKDSQGVGGANYYMELEQIKLDSNEATVATLKFIRNRSDG